MLAICYLAQKEKSPSRTQKTQKTAEWIFSISLVLLLIAGFVLVYTEI